MNLIFRVIFEQQCIFIANQMYVVVFLFVFLTVYYLRHNVFNTQLPLSDTSERNWSLWILGAINIRMSRLRTADLKTGMPTFLAAKINGDQFHVLPVSICKQFETWNNNNNKYISPALNPSVSDLREAQNAVHSVKTKEETNKERNKQKTSQRHQEIAGDGRVKRQGPTRLMIHYITLSHPVSLSPSLSPSFPPPPTLPPLSPSPSLSSPSLTPCLLPSLPLPPAPFHWQISKSNNNSPWKQNKQKQKSSKGSR